MGRRRPAVGTIIKRRRCSRRRLRRISHTTISAKSVCRGERSKKKKKISTQIKSNRKSENIVRNVKTVKTERRRNDTLNSSFTYINIKPHTATAISHFRVRVRQYYYYYDFGRYAIVARAVK